MFATLRRPIAILLLLAAPLSTGCATMNDQTGSKSAGGNTALAKKSATKQAAGDHFPTPLEAGMGNL